MRSDAAFPLTPVEQGMLFHHLSGPHSGVDIEQMVVTLTEPLDPAAFHRAWDQLANRHGAFRSAIEWDGRPYPVHVEHTDVSIPWAEVDLRDLGPGEKRERQQAFLEEDRQRGFEFRVAPLARASLLRTDDDAWTFVWTFHHILADGHCYPALIQEAFARYDAVRANQEHSFTQPRPFREYVDWLTAHLEETKASAESFWRETLKGLSGPTPLPGACAGDAGQSGRGEYSLRLSQAATAALAAFASRHDLRMSTLVQAAWAFVLGAYSGEEDVIFGVIRSGRRPTPNGVEDTVGLCISSPPLRVELPPQSTVLAWLQAVRGRQRAMRHFAHTPLVDIHRWSGIPPTTPLFESIVVFTPRLVGEALRELGGPWAHRDVRFLEQTNYSLALFAYGERELLLKLDFDRTRLCASVVASCLDLLKSFLEGIPAAADCRLADLSLVTARQRQTLVTDWNATARNYAKDRCVHELFEDQVQRTPEAIAVVFRDRSLTYREVNQRANRLARRLRSLGVGPGHFVGIFLSRSPDLLVAMLATLKAGGAYVPMDPTYPQQRLSWMLEDTQATVVLSQRELTAAIPPNVKHVVYVESEDEVVGPADEDANCVSGVRATDLAYVIFTSGSSGRPKGVMVEHRNVTNYFVAMDERLGFKEPGTWLAVTSISFDISVQELLWTLARGFKVVLQEETARPPAADLPARRFANQKMDFSLFYFAADGEGPSKNGYRLLLEGARYADQNGFSAVWTPERHFHAFGGLYPNPAVTGAAVAAITSRIKIRAGSVVLPLHNPIRVAEEWSVVDNLSRGRVGLSFATGWHANDFALLPENYQERREITLRGIDTVRRLWRGEGVQAVSGTGDAIQVRIFPAPVQREPPIWMTSAGNVETFRSAGQLGVNLLTNLLGQKPEDLAEKIAAYREARRQHGHTGKGHVTLMLHTFVGPDLDGVRRKVRTPFLEYLKTSTDLIKKARWEFPAFAPTPDRQLQPLDDGDLSDADMRAIMDHAFDRYFQTSGLFGTPETCLDMVDRLKSIGVDEIACLIDFGVDDDSVLESLRHLNIVRQRSNPPEQEADYTIPGQIRRHGVTHLQCTPSLARILVSEPDSLDSIRPLRKLLVGGEALPTELAGQLAKAIEGELINMYGPTETTVWSTAALVEKAGGPVTIGRPLANTQVYVLDRHLRPVPVGVPGELFIGGDGVTRGYLNRPDLTEERFLPDPFGSTPGMRLYRTGDLARYLQDGRIEFLGRLDQQIKIRGYRIEPGEIEAVLASHGAVRECVVVPRTHGAADQTLVAYVASGAGPVPNDSGAILWRRLWESAYSGLKNGSHTASDPTLNTTGWINSETGQLIPDGEMQEWVQGAVGRILAFQPRRVLEIGCGTGMLLFQIAPHCEHYHGVDFSANAIDYVAAEVERQGLSNVTLSQAAADALPLLEPDSFEVVIINSVIQYFPSAEYLVNVLKRAASLVRKGGGIFIGDVRSLPLNEAFHTSVALDRAPDETPAADVRQRALQRVQRDRELVLDPEFFRAVSQQLPADWRVGIHLKRGRHRNEMSRFRYDVLFHFSGRAVAAIPAEVEPGANVSVSQIHDRLGSGAPIVAYSGLRNPRVVKAIEAVELLNGNSCPETVAAMRRALGSTPEEGIDPEDLYTLDVPYDIELTWSSSALNAYDATFRHRSATAADPPAADTIPAKAWGEYTNLRGTALAPTLALELKDWAKQRLPDYMVPAAIVVVDALPRTPNGKIDRKALPEPGRDSRASTTEYVAPTTDVEKTISAIWKELLQLERVGTHDNLFDLGANSLLVVQANGRLKAALGRDLSVVDLFRYPTVTALAAYVNGAAEEQSALAQSQERGRARLDALQRRRTAPRPDSTRA